MPETLAKIELLLFKQDGEVWLDADIDCLGVANLCTAMHIGMERDERLRRAVLICAGTFLENEKPNGG